MTWSLVSCGYQDEVQFQNGSAGEYTFVSLTVEDSDYNKCVFLHSQSICSDSVSMYR